MRDRPLPLPEGVERWRPGTSVLVDGVAELWPVEAWTLDGGLVHIGLSADAQPLVLRVSQSGAVESPVYELRPAGLRAVVPRFVELLVRERSSDVELERWASLLTRQLRLCPSCGAEAPLGATCGCGVDVTSAAPLIKPSPSETESARQRHARLFAAARLVRGFGFPELMRPWDLLALTRARSAETLVESWSKRAVTLTAAQRESLERFIAARR